MRNTTMRDKLAMVLSSAESETDIAVEETADQVVEEPEVTPPISAKKTKLVTSKAKSTVAKKAAKKVKSTKVQKAKPKAEEEATKEEAPAPRYVTPPKRKNPFAVHVYPLDDAAIEQERQKEPAPSSKVQAVVTSSESLAVPIKKPSVVIVTPPPEIAPKVEVVPTEPKTETKPQPQPAQSSIVWRLEADRKPLMAPVIAPPPVEEESTEDVAEPEELPSEPEALKKDEPEAEPQPLEEEENKPPVSLPTNLAWLDKPTPFGADLRAIVDDLRTAKSNVAFALEQSRIRRQKKQAELDQEDFAILELQDNLQHIDDTISACSLVAEQSMGIKKALLSSVQSENKAVKRHINMPAKDDVTIFHLDELRTFFAANPNTNWRVAEIVNELPKVKQAHAKTYLPAALASLMKRGEVQHVGVGIYRAMPPKQPEQQE
jgi:hypothetical protein